MQRKISIARPCRRNAIVPKKRVGSAVAPEIRLDELADFLFGNRRHTGKPNHQVTLNLGDPRAPVVHQRLVPHEGSRTIPRIAFRVEYVPQPHQVAERQVNLAAFH